MSSRGASWVEGAPSWADLLVPDRKVAIAFYGGLFGWEFTESGPAQHHYTLAHHNERPVAGIGEAPADQPETIAAWTTYLAVDDVQDVARRIATEGGTIRVGPVEIEPFGQLAVVADPGGAVFGLRQSDDHLEEAVRNEPGTMCWNEAVTTDFEAARAFYTAVFGFEFQDLSGPDFQYGVLHLGGRPVGGLGAIGGEMEGIAPHWSVYFAVEDTDAAVVRAVDLGGTVNGSPRDSTYGRMAVLTGPSGEAVSIIAPADPSPVLDT